MKIKQKGEVETGSGSKITRVTAYFAFRFFFAGMIGKMWKPIFVGLFGTKNRVRWGGVRS